MSSYGQIFYILLLLKILTMEDACRMKIRYYQVQIFEQGVANRLVIKGLNFHKGLFLKLNCFLVILMSSELSICLCTFTTKFLETFSS